MAERDSRPPIERVVDEASETLGETLSPEVWTTVNRRLIEKIVAEFAYEELFEPSAVGSADEVAAAERSGDRAWRRYRLDFDGVVYRFTAAERLFDSYRVAEDSVERRVDDGEWTAASDAVQLLLDARETVGIDGQTLAYLVHEYNNTLLADAHIHRRKAAADGSILDRSFAEMEGEMEGHPWFTYNKGRVGFGYSEYLAHAPERSEPRRLSWLAARRDRATFEAVSDLSYQGLLDSELGGHADVFADRLAKRGLDPANYYLLPVHDWQFDNSVAQLFAADLATDGLVPLGRGPDRYLPQQSIRTLTNVDSPERRHVKLPLRIRNTNVYRGLLGEHAEAAPAVTAFVKRVRDEDPFLADECEVLLPGEVASVNYEHSTYSQIEDAPYQFHELLGAVWRESVEGMLREGERPLTLAALLHTDYDGRPLAAKLAARSPRSLDDWLDRLFSVLLRPLLHYLYRYGTVFMPHGTNVVLVLRDGVPERIAVKDFVDEVGITDRDLPELTAVLPEGLRRDDRFRHHVLHQHPPNECCQHIFGTLFVCVLRYVSDLLERECGYAEERFWRGVRDAIRAYQAEFPELRDRFETFDLFQPEFGKVCLNRNRIVDYGYDDYATRPKVGGHGTVSNPLVTVDEE